MNQNIRRLKEENFSLLFLLNPKYFPPWSFVRKIYKTLFLISPLSYLYRIFLVPFVSEKDASIGCSNGTPQVFPGDLIGRILFSTGRHAGYIEPIMTWNPSWVFHLLAVHLFLCFRIPVFFPHLPRARLFRPKGSRTRHFPGPIIWSSCPWAPAIRHTGLCSQFWGGNCVCSRRSKRLTPKPVWTSLMVLDPHLDDIGLFLVVVW